MVHGYGVGLGSRLMVKDSVMAMGIGQAPS